MAMKVGFTQLYLHKKNRNVPAPLSCTIKKHETMWPMKQEPYLPPLLEPYLPPLLELLQKPGNRCLFLSTGVSTPSYTWLASVYSSIRHAEQLAKGIKPLTHNSTVLKLLD